MHRPDSITARLLRIREAAVQLIVKTPVPELGSWKGAFLVVGLWCLLTLGAALLRVYVLLRLCVQRGGFRFVIALVTTVVLVGAATLAVMIFGALSGGLGGGFRS